MTNPASDKPSVQISEGVLLAFTAGFVDTVGFVGLFGLFTAHVTGNFVLIGASLVQQRPGVIAKLLALPTFILVVAAVRLWSRRCERLSRPVRRVLLLTQILLLIGFLLAGLKASPIVDADAGWAIGAALLGVAAMALQNAAGRLAFAHLSPTTVMTGNVTQAVIDAVDLLFRAPQSDAIRARFVKMWPAVLAFALGAILGALGIAHVGFLCLLCPIAALSVVAFLVKST
jgi:uncharacterized membrane protein YoaK (UPF0700 family)